jgi:phage host-nuclease inhibitor protein Gam
MDAESTESTESTERFEIRDHATAAWAIEKINAARALVAYREQASKVWVEEAVREVRALEDRFSAELRAWGLAQLATQTKKTIVLQTGRLEFRNKPARFSVTNETAAIAWAKRFLPEAVVVTEEVVAKALTDYAKKTGEVPDGVEKVDAKENDSFSIK